MNETRKLPIWFWIVAVVAILWNLMGVAAFGYDLRVPGNAETMASLTEAQQDLYRNQPFYEKIVYALATICGLLASIGLVLRKRWSILLFMVSLMAVILQNVFGYFNNAYEIMGTGYVLPALVVLIAAFLLWFSRSTAARGYLT